MKHIARIAGCLFLLVQIVAAPACKKMPMFALDGTTLVVSADKVNLRTGGDKAVVTVVGFNEDGEPLHDHTRILFTATLGSIPASAEMFSGRATVEFISGDRGGIAAIEARSGSITATPSPLEIAIGAGALKTLTVHANPAQLGAKGGKSLISVYAFDESLNLLADIPVILSTSAGKLDRGNSIRLTDKNGLVSEYLYTEENATVSAESGSITAEIEVTVAENQLPSADFSISPVNPRIGETIYFNSGLSSDPDGSLVGWEWNFGDGDTASGQEMTHVYDAAGSFSVSLEVTDNNGGKGCAEKTVVISSNQLPSADFSISPADPRIAETVFFNAGSSSDPDGSLVGWEWNFGDGATASGQQATHAYGAAGSFSVTLKVTDDSGGKGSAEKTIAISSNQLPSAEFSISPADPRIAETVYFNAGSSSDPDGSVVGWEWNFGDGAMASGQQALHVYDAAGTFLVTLKVTDDNGGSGYSEKTIVISSNLLPSASFSISPADPWVGETVNFNAGSSSDPDGSLVAWEWNFGDGRSSRGENTSHVYLRSGSFLVTLKVTDDNGGNGYSEKTIVISSNQLPRADFSISPAGPKTGETVYFNASASSDPDGSITGWKWDFGDGGTASGLEASHVYGAAGTFTVTLTVTDDSGGSDSCQKSVIVSE